MVTGIATANMDSIPLVIISGQVATPLIGRDSFQEADISGITTPITKHNYLVKDVKELPRVLKEAFYIASTGRPGPVLVDIAKDVFDTSFEFEYPRMFTSEVTVAIRKAAKMMWSVPLSLWLRQNGRSSSPAVVSSYRKWQKPCALSCSSSGYRS